MGSYLLLIIAALAAGLINSVAGGGMFLTFPALVFTGVPSIVLEGHFLFSGAQPVEVIVRELREAAAGHANGRKGSREEALRVDDGR